MEKVIVILTNELKRNEILRYLDTDQNLPTDLTKKVVYTDVMVIVLDDECDLEDFQNELDNLGVQGQIDYLAYHNTAITNEDSGLNIEDLEADIFKNTLKKGFSHEVSYTFPNNFYNVFLPKIYFEGYGDITLEHIEKYFPSSLELSLNLLNDIQSGKPKPEFYKEEIYKDLVTKSETVEVFNSLEKDWCYKENEDEVINDLRDKLISYATKK